jgi:hypothetical protein
MMFKRPTEIFSRGTLEFLADMIVFQELRT